MKNYYDILEIGMTATKENIYDGRKHLGLPSYFVKK